MDAFETGPYGLALLFLLLLGFHSLAIGFPYLIHYYDNVARGNERRPSARGYVRAFAVEWYFGAALNLSYLFGIPGGAVNGTYDPSGGPPILMCHGFFQNRASFFAIYWRLRRAGYRNLYVVNLRPLRAPLEEQAEHLANMIRTVSAAAQGRAVVGIGHSQGGILLRWIATRYGDVPLARLFTLGSPHHGTRLAYFGLAPNARQMQPESKALAALGTSVPIPLTSFYSDLDQIVNPAESATLGDDNRFVAETGHFSLLYSPEVADAIIAELPQVAALQRATTS